MYIYIYIERERANERERERPSMIGTGFGGLFYSKYSSLLCRDFCGASITSSSDARSRLQVGVCLRSAHSKFAGFGGFLVEGQKALKERWIPKRQTTALASVSLGVLQPSSFQCSLPQTTTTASNLNSISSGF